MMNALRSRGIPLGLCLLTSASCLGQTPDALTIRKVIDNECMNARGTKNEVDRVTDLAIPDGGRTIPARLYRPKSAGPLPVLMFFHGGGYIAGNLDTHDNACRYLASRIPCLVIAVDYRLAPEHKFPAQPEECYAATAWAASHALAQGGDPGRMAVIGDSGGGTLVAAVCLLARDRAGPRLRAQVLINPALDMSAYDRRGFEDMRLFRDSYLREPKDSGNPLASPLLASRFEGLPPAFVIVGEKDLLRAEGEAYVAKLRGAGVRANAYCQYGQGHLGPEWAAATPTAEEALDLPVGFLRAVLRPNG